MVINAISTHSSTFPIDLTNQPVSQSPASKSYSYLTCKALTHCAAMDSNGSYTNCTSHVRRTLLKIKPDGYMDYSEYNVEDGLFAPYDFEVIDWKDWATWIHTRWYWAPYAGVIYILAIFGIQALMRNRAAFDLKRELFLWNAALGIFSIVGFIRFSPDYILRLTTEGGFKGICDWYGTKPQTFWTLAFVLSKYVELGDTVFIVLRKKKLQVLQWYHHIATLCAVWLTGPLVEPISGVYMVMNYGVHSLMYPYFALRALDVKIPKFIANLITTLQLTQMLIGLAVNIYSGRKYYLDGPESCNRHPDSLKFFIFLYGSFTFLFGQLFYDLVVKSQEKNKGKRVKAE